MANNTDYQRRRWNQVVKQMDELIEINAPDSLKADHCITVLLPRLISILGIQKEFSASLGKFLTRQICGYTGMCLICQKVDAIYGDECCAKCIAEIDKIDEQSKEFTEDDIS